VPWFREDKTLHTSFADIVSPFLEIWTTCIDPSTWREVVIAKLGHEEVDMC
jgi:hypothetical protein